MASKDQGADKTEKPTAKRIRDARKEGNVSKSRELTATVLTLGWLVTGWLLMGFMYSRLRELFDQSLRAIQLPFREALLETSAIAFQTLLWLSLPLLAMALLLGVAIALEAGSGARAGRRHRVTDPPRRRDRRDADAGRSHRRAGARPGLCFVTRWFRQRWRSCVITAVSAIPITIEAITP